MLPRQDRGGNPGLVFGLGMLGTVRGPQWHCDRCSQSGFQDVSRGVLSGSCAFCRRSRECPHPFHTPRGLLPGRPSKASSTRPRREVISRMFHGGVLSGSCVFGRRSRESPHPFYTPYGASCLAGPARLPRQDRGGNPGLVFGLGMLGTVRGPQLAL